jgi:hypothetical protein
VWFEFVMVISSDLLHYVWMCSCVERRGIYSPLIYKIDKQIELMFSVGIPLLFVGGGIYSL